MNIENIKELASGVEIDAGLLETAGIVVVMEDVVVVVCRAIRDDKTILKGRYVQGGVLMMEVIVEVQGVQRRTRGHDKQIKYRSS